MENFEIKSPNENDLKLKRLEIQKSAMQAMFENADKTHNVIHKKDHTPKIGDYFRTFRMELKKITSIKETRPHKGIYEIEHNRESISVVHGQTVTFSLQEQV